MILIFALLLLSIGSAWAGQVRCNILQHKLDRLYFPFGEEANIFANSRFVLYNNTDSLMTGRIASSQPGVSYSYQLDSSLALSNIDSLHAIIETADIDSVSTIRIGFDLPEGRKSTLLYSENIPGESAPLFHTVTSAGNPLEIVIYDSFLEMTLALEAHQIDGCISFNEYKSFGVDITTTAYPAEYFAVLIPNITHPVNERGILSTSMYYRFNSAQSSAYFAGDGIRQFNSLYFKESSVPRFYDYDPEKGRSLLKALGKKPKEISIAVSEAALIETANYFIDILNRDRIKCRLEEDRDKDHDLYMDFVPLSENDRAASLKYIVSVISADTVSGEPVNTILKIIDNYIRQGDALTDAVSANYFYDRAERSLIDDLGVFPLFRSTIYMTAYDYIRNFDYDMYINNRFDMIGRISLPGGASE